MLQCVAVHFVSRNSVCINMLQCVAACFVEFGAVLGTYPWTGFVVARWILICIWFVILFLFSLMCRHVGPGLVDFGAVYEFVVSAATSVSDFREGIISLLVFVLWLFGQLWFDAWICRVIYLACDLLDVWFICRRWMARWWTQSFSDT